MQLVELIKALDISVGELSLYVVLILTMIQIAPIKIDPWSWIARRIGKAINYEVIKKVEDLEAKMNSMEEKAEEREAVNFRVRILRFNDELQDGRKHSKDSFDQVLSDITSYDQYCDTHPKFRNNQTTATVSYIQKCYADRLEKHDFI